MTAQSSATLVVAKHRFERKEPPLGGFYRFAAAAI